jgi:hypothetical protein
VIVTRPERLVLDGFSEKGKVMVEPQSACDSERPSAPRLGSGHPPSERCAGHFEFLVPVEEGVTQALVIDAEFADCREASTEAVRKTIGCHQSRR